MAVFADYRGLPESARGASIALGNFDGLHVGHKAVMEAARLAGQGRFSVATFEPPPRFSSSSVAVTLWLGSLSSTVTAGGTVSGAGLTKLGAGTLALTGSTSCGYRRQ